MEQYEIVLHCPRPWIKQWGEFTHILKGHCFYMNCNACIKGLSILTHRLVCVLKLDVFHVFGVVRWFYVHTCTFRLGKVVSVYCTWKYFAIIVLVTFKGALKYSLFTVHGHHCVGNF